MARESRPNDWLGITLTPFQEFFRQEAAGGIVLVACAAVAMAWANSPWAADYHELFATVLSVKLGGEGIEKPLLLWINDGLMAVFFFLVGLEIKREVISGELSGFRKAALPAAAAVGGMVVPALIYLLVNWSGDGVRGWAIPMATDIAFVIGILALLGNRVPAAAKVFLVALAIVDDIGAVLVIALFYTDHIHVAVLGSAAGAFAFLVVLNLLGFRSAGLYVLGAAMLWYFVLKSGVHATVAGLLAALTIPARSGRKILPFPAKALHSKGHPPEDRQPRETTIATHLLKNLDPLSNRLEHALHPWVAFLIMPVFALANAGVTLEKGFLSEFLHPISLGIMAGLFLGKQIGILGASWLAVKAGLAEIPEDVGWRQIHGLGALAGIGFTMSLFIATLGFEQGRLLDTAKTAILAASLLSGILGWFLLRFAPAARQPA
ncbi:MAG: Na+/H+ antiporter NhaA [Thermogutta sp.]